MKIPTTLLLLATACVALLPQDTLGQATDGVCKYYLRPSPDEKFAPGPPPPRQSCEHGQVFKDGKAWRCATVEECQSPKETTICNGRAKNMYVEKEGVFLLRFTSEAVRLPEACQQ